MKRVNIYIIYFYFVFMLTSCNSIPLNPKKFPSHPIQKDYYKEAERHYKKKEYQKAIWALKQKLKEDPKHIDSMFKLGVCYHRLNEYDEAVTAYQDVLSLKPDHAKASFNLGLIYTYEKNSNPAKAVQYLTQYMELEPNSSLQTDLKKLIQRLQKKMGVEKKKQQSTISETNGAQFLSGDKTDTKISELKSYPLPTRDILLQFTQQLAKDKPSNKSTGFQDSGELQIGKLISSNTFSMDEDPHLISEEYYQQAKKSFQNSEYQATIVRCQIALLYNKRNIQALHLLGIGYSKLDQPSNAIEAIKEAIALDNDELELHVDLARLYMKTNQTDDAVTEWREVIKLDPNNQEAKDYVNKLSLE